MGEHLDCAELLLKHGADINFHDGPASIIGSATLLGRMDYVNWALDHVQLDTISSFNRTEPPPTRPSRTKGKGTGEDR